MVEVDGAIVDDEEEILTCSVGGGVGGGGVDVDIESTVFALDDDTFGVTVNA